MTDRAPLLIGFAGLAGAGKTTTAHALATAARRHGITCHTISFADPIREMIRLLLDYQSDPTADLSVMVRGQYKESPSPYLNGRTPRYAMQTLGTEWGRDLIHPDLWVSVAHRRIAAGKADVYVFDDVRFENEVEFIVGATGSVYWLDRPSFIPVEGDHPSENPALADNPSVVRYYCDGLSAEVIADSIMALVRARLQPV